MSTSIWRNKNFVFFICGQGISKFGSAISSFAIPWLILKITGSALQMGLIFAIGFIPYLLLSLPAGVWADRHNRKTIMLTVDLCRVILIFSIPLSSYFYGQITIVHLYILQILMSGLNSLYDAASGACLPNVVLKNQLKQANSIMQTIVSIGQVLGPILAGTLVTLIEAQNVIIMHGISLLISIWSLLFITGNFKIESNVKRAEQHMTKEISEAITYIWNHSMIRTLSVITLISNLCNSIIAVILIYRIQQELLLTPHLAGLVMGGFSLGGVAASIISGVFSKKVNMKTLIYFILIIQIIPPLLIGLSANPYIIILATIIMGAAAMFWNIYSLTLRQMVIPDHLLGRATATIRLTVFVSMPVGSSIGGYMGDFLGAATTFVILSVLRSINFIYAMSSPLLKKDKDNELELMIAENK